MTKTAPEKWPAESEEYARFKELTRKLVAVPKKELTSKTKTAKKARGQG